MAIFKTPTDVFPNIKIPVIAVVWAYAGLLPTEVSGRITYLYERQLTSNVEGIEHIESHSYYGSSIIKIFLQPGIDLAAAEADIASISQTVTKQLSSGYFAADGHASRGVLRSGRHAASHSGKPDAR